jgi:hypothetical protein
MITSGAGDRFTIPDWLMTADDAGIMSSWLSVGSNGEMPTTPSRRVEGSGQVDSMNVGSGKAASMSATLGEGALPKRISGLADSTNANSVAVVDLRLD